jgi:hypothetical protein
MDARFLSIGWATETDPEAVARKGRARYPSHAVALAEEAGDKNKADGYYGFI